MEYENGSGYEETEGTSSGSYKPSNAKQSNMALASLIMGILSIVTACCCYGGFIFGGLGILFALLSNTGDRMENYAKTGLITSIIGMVLGIVFLILMIALGFFTSNPFGGDF
jgi:glucan phosphoethanolaminetransferase (alkaline phosphatase superfamily)